ncbi:dihydrofolate reductase family protein [Pseudoduganella violacea]|uniref:Dihydrofolate reductase n=1 Tax=Pseudoduganella violacea TaxID=1715466 RepID=A0A7W5B6X9_9BURK|nr:dihydrofolate reductase family protein [Pseudoduganella violacea]MBB3117689.1 dihydrofolate reductase [Pseudoduganella violacea]
MKASVFVGCSLDGFIARPDGALDWLMGEPEAGSAPPEHGYDAFMAGIDTVLMGRKTFETVQAMGIWPYTGKRVVVLSTTLATLPGSVAGKAELQRGPMAALVAQLAADGCQGLYVDGGATIQACLRAGLIDEITISRLPVLIGSGIALFCALPHDVKLEHLRSKIYEGGMVQSVYRVLRVT